MSVNPEAMVRGQKALNAFNVTSATYQTIGDHNITVDVLIPKDLKPGKQHPVIIRFHGGFLITGQSLFLGHFSAWSMHYALREGAIIVSPNYPKLPESTALQLMDSISHLYEWVHEKLNDVVSAATEGHVGVDKTKMLVFGCSAGGYLAVQSAITQPAGTFKAVIAGYPMLDFKSPFFTQHYEKRPFGRADELPSSMIDEHIAAVKPGEIISAILSPKRIDLAVAAVQHGRFPEMLQSNDTSLYPLETLESAKTYFPPLFIYHGVNDSAVEAEGTRRFLEKYKEVMPEGKVLVKLEPGEHGFDSVVGLDEPWLKEGLEFVTKAWLG